MPRLMPFPKSPSKAQILARIYTSQRRTVLGTFAMLYHLLGRLSCLDWNEREAMRRAIKNIEQRVLDKLELEFLRQRKTNEKK